MSDGKKYYKEEEKSKSRNTERTEYGVPKYGMSENVQESFVYPHWLHQNMEWTPPSGGYPFEQQYGYCTEAIPHFPDGDVVPSTFGQNKSTYQNANMHGKSRKKSHGKKKIPLKYIPWKNRRNVTFCKRKTGLMKKAYELSILTKAEVLLMVANGGSNNVYTFATKKFRPVTEECQDFIQGCLNRDDVENVESENWSSIGSPGIDSEDD